LLCVVLDYIIVDLAFGLLLVADLLQN